MALTGLRAFTSRAMATSVADTFVGNMDRSYAEIFSRSRLGGQLYGNRTVVVGLDNVIEHLRASWQVAMIASVGGSRMMAEEVKTVSQAMCPYKSGDLCDSAKVEGEGKETIANPDYDPFAGATGVSPYMTVYPLGAFVGRRFETSSWYRVVYDKEYALVVHENFKGYPSDSFRQDAPGAPPLWEGHPKGPQYLKRALDALAPRLSNKVQRILQAALAEATAKMQTAPVIRPGLGMGAPRLRPRIPR